MIAIVIFFFFNDTATTEIYTLSLHDALPITLPGATAYRASVPSGASSAASPSADGRRSEEHTSELQSRQYLVCRLLLEKKKDIVDMGKIQLHYHPLLERLTISETWSQYRVIY